MALSPIHPTAVAMHGVNARAPYPSIIYLLSGKSGHINQEQAMNWDQDCIINREPASKLARVNQEQAIYWHHIEGNHLFASLGSRLHIKSRTSH